MGMNLEPLRAALEERVDLARAELVEAQQLLYAVGPLPSAYEVPLRSALAAAASLAAARARVDLLDELEARAAAAGAVLPTRA